MGSVPAELSLDFVPKTITDFLCYISTTNNATLKLFLLDDFISKLELELSKIQAFKRELPLCIFLLNDAISALKVESAKCRVLKSEPVLEEFIPLKRECDQREESEKEKECKDNKKNWMSSVQLWNTDNNYKKNACDCDKKPNFKQENKENYEEERQSVAEGLFQYGRNRNGGRGFMMPFSTTKGEKEDCVAKGLSLQTPGTVMKNSREGYGSRTSSSRVVSSSPLAPPQPQSARKQRRCWSPELHLRFVKALEELGGSQVATPRQIREFMRVDGLTNDEVKSHLQKYRLHTRRVPLATATTANRSVAVLGGLWMHNESSKGSSSDSPQGPLQLATRSGEGTSPTEGDNMIDDDVKSEL
ncbi:myb family transcription factor EFM-like [Abrus precatorius]|uniref:Myb family transcription factor EFM-like n=1 Tax=Abrus precatorius TaxID=3816 RepID=A0A8B8M096_ABRPR|nr:myb family transcription factor EFM-like [Abrus precatorius]